MLTFLFWNIGRKPLAAELAALTNEHDVDVLMLAESAIDTSELLSALNASGQSFAPAPPLAGLDVTVGADRSAVEFFINHDPIALEPRGYVDRMSVYELKLPGRLPLLVAGVHLPDKLWVDPASQSRRATSFARAVRSIEDSLTHARTLVLGDFNMDPFEEGMIAADGFHGVMTRERASRGYRRIASAEYPFFYNPMWSRLGDHSPGPPGSYHYQGSGEVVYFWHSFDQALLRPELLPFFKSDDFQVIERVNETSLVSKRGLPRRSRFSDHLPILIRLSL